MYVCMRPVFFLEPDSVLLSEDYIPYNFGGVRENLCPEYGRIR